MQGAWWWSLFFLGCLVQSCCREGGTLQTNITGMCSQCLGHTGFGPAHGVCASPVYTAQASGCSAGSGPWVACTSQIYAAQVQVLGYSTKAQTQLGLRFVLPRPKQLRRPSAWRAHTPQVRCILSPSWSQPLGFLGVQLHLRCAVCLFWGADLWLRPS